MFRESLFNINSNDLNFELFNRRVDRKTLDSIKYKSFRFFQKVKIVFKNIGFDFEKNQF